MSTALSVAIAQLNPHIGNIAANVAGIRAARAAAAAMGADLLVTPELSVVGYPPEDLVRKPAFVADCAQAVAALAAETGDGGPAMLVGAPWLQDGKLFNAAFLLDGGVVVARRAKQELPNYGVFDDKRVFDAGPAPEPVAFRGVRLGLLVCEDWWFGAVAATLAAGGADILISINASPFEQDKHAIRVGLAVQRVVQTGLPFVFCASVGGQDKHAIRVGLAVQRVVQTGLPFVFCASVGGQDELVFEGGSFVLNADQTLAVQLPTCAEALVLTRWSRSGEGLVCERQALPAEPPALELVYRCLMLGLADYVRRNGFGGVLLGLSGGIDSALSAAIATDALGAGRVRAVMLPSPYTAAESLADASACAALLGVRLDTVPISPAMGVFDAALAPLLVGQPPGVTQENIQSRTRGLMLMALSNTFGDMLLTTGNKSEMSVGYATLYGDMCGGFSVLKDVYKTEVFALSAWRNAHVPQGALGPAGAVMPQRVIDKPPSAELRPGQTDQDTLPPYATLDAILGILVEQEGSVDQAVAAGHDRATVLRVWHMLDRAEYKRRQAPPGVKISARAFGRDRRYPITNGYTDLVA